MRKSEIAARMGGFRIGLTEPEAAAALGISQGFFRKLVEEGLMPRPRLLHGRRLYDPDEVRMAFRSLPREGGDLDVDTWADYP